MVRAKAIKTLKKNHGVESPLRSPELLQAQRQTNLRRRGVENVSQSEDIKLAKIITTRRNYGADNPSQVESIKLKKEASTKKTLGVENPFQSEALMSQVREDRFQRTGFRYVSQDPEVRKKIVASFLENFGVTHPMQNREVFEKVMKSQYRIKELVLGRRVYRYQGWEDTVIRALVAKYGNKEVLTQFDSGFPDTVFAEAKTFPDLYIRSIETFVEVKSIWTLMGRLNSLKVNQNKARRLNESGNTCRWVVVTNHPRSEYVVLPEDWYLMKLKRLKEYLQK